MRTGKTLQHIHLCPPPLIQTTSHFLEEPCKLMLPLITHHCCCASNQWAPTPAAINTIESFPVIVKLLVGHEKAQKKRIFIAAVRAVGFVKLGSRDTWTPVPSCPKHYSPASPLCNLIPRRNEEDQLHPYFCGKEFELHEHTAGMIPAWTQKIKFF